MIIKKISLYNFRQFQDEQIIEFSNDEDKNITLILGDNTSGKTTILQAFLWGFYGKANFKSKDSLLNAKVAQEMLTTKQEKDVRISIELEHQDVNYFLTRSLTHYVKSGEIKASAISKVDMKYKQSDGQIENIPTHQIQNKIGEILPEDLAIYFLYDTERFGNITSKADVTSSVKGILGLTVLDNMIKHIGTPTKSKSVLGQFNSSLNLEGNKNATEAYERFKKAEERKEEVETRLEQKKKEREAYSKSVDERQAILRSLEKTAQLQAEKDKKVKMMNFEKSALKTAQEHFYSSFKNNTPMFLGHSLFQKAMAELANANLDKKSIRDMNANAIKDIIERGICVCGTEVCEGNEAHKHLLEEIRYLPPESIGTLLKFFKEKADLFSKTGEGYFTQLDNSYKNIFNNLQKMSELEDEIQFLNDELKKEDSVEKHQEILIELEAKVEKLSDDIDLLNQELGELKKSIKDDKATYEQNIKLSDRNNELLKYIEYANQVLEWVTNHRDTREHDIKEQLEEKVNNYFSKMYHGKRKVTIDDKFRVNLVTTDLLEEIHTDESQGLETVKNFAFISGLVDLAKQKLQDAYEKEAEAYPLILDAPFSNADEKHVKNISEVLPNVAKQLILIVMAKDWNYAKNALSSKVGKEYYLNKKSEIYTKIT
ncbi:AAA family ATPase [Fictibacillus sp. KIGAM418]|uniref:Nuclease SbcCD subunit C n=1 Tax=Fictibacillus marinisediminis TaxID=2878389 RepID=A0A9X1X7B0_9BACL|nr:AAA family ATPase [Fictibacillus marinisediminis]MCK6255457.1 AAA family ATPase [Fictibacillus marinisediminis]